MNVTFRQLSVFVEVAQRGSMAGAATALHLTPPAVSMQIKEMESQIGLPLFDRQGRRASLSTAGEYFLVHARRMLAQLKDAENAMARLKHLDQGALTIGMVSTAKYFVPRLLARFHDEHPAVEVRLKVANNREQLMAWMVAGEADVSIMGRPLKEMAARSEAFAGHPLVFICNPEHPLAHEGRLPARVLEDHALIVRESGSGTRDALERYCTLHRVDLRISMELQSNETIKQSVMAGLGLSFVSLHTVGLEVGNRLLQVLDVEGTPVMRTWNVVHLNAKVLSPAAEAFRYFMLEHGEAHLLAHDAPLLGPMGAG